MGGFFAVASKDDCVQDLFYGTDYHSHLGTKRGGLVVMSGESMSRGIHNIENAQFRSKFEDDILEFHGRSGIGVISDTDSQPLLINSHLGQYGIVTVAKINNMKSLIDQAFRNRRAHFSEMSGGSISPTELVATLINHGDTFEEGLRYAQETIDGSCSILLLTEKGIYAARDFFGRTPIIIGRKKNAFCATFETCAFYNLDYELHHELGPAEVVLLTAEGIQTVLPAIDQLRICSFHWIYYGYPASSYEGINVESTRYRCGIALARRDNVKVDMVAGIPDSGSAHALGYAHETKLPYGRPFVKYTPTWPRSFMPQNQNIRDLVARMKLIPIRDLIHGKRLLFCEDSIVRGTQLKDTIRRLFDLGAREIHMRPACPPLIHGCRFLNFSQSRSELDLAGRRAIAAMENDAETVPPVYSDPDSDQYGNMVERICDELNLTTLQYQRLPDMVQAIGLPKDKLCTYCWDGKG
ncbi:amidophosphoribosyltransferase [bacterium]|nr:amidophosphoribosyltransferase [bacterium]